MFTQEQINEIMKTPYENSVVLGEKYGVPSRRIQAYRRNHGAKVRKLFKPEKEEFIRVYNQYKSTRAVAEYYNVAMTTVRKYANKIGYDISKKPILQDKECIDLIENRKTLSNKEITEKFNISDSSLYRILNKYNEDKKDTKIYTLDEDYFKNIDSIEKAYFLGFISADGNVEILKSGCYTFTLTVSIKDIEILDKLNESINTNKPIKTYYKKGFQYARIIITNNAFVSNLMNIGVKPRKTWDNTIIDLPEKYMSHYLRGYFDGDGSILFRKKTSNYAVSISGFEHNMNRIKEYLDNKNIYSSFYLDKREYNITETSGKFGSLSFGNKTSMYSFLKYIYKDNNGYCLSRKREKVNKFINMIEESNRDCDKQIVNYYKYAVQGVG